MQWVGQIRENFETLCLEFISNEKKMDYGAIQHGKKPVDEHDHRWVDGEGFGL